MNFEEKFNYIKKVTHSDSINKIREFKTRAKIFWSGNTLWIDTDDDNNIGDYPLCTDKNDKIVYEKLYKGKFVIDDDNILYYIINRNYDCNCNDIYIFSNIIQDCIFRELLRVYRQKDILNAKFSVGDEVVFHYPGITNNIGIIIDIRKSLTGLNYWYTLENNNNQTLDIIEEAIDCTFEEFLLNAKNNKKTVIIYNK